MERTATDAVDIAVDYVRELYGDEASYVAVEEVDTEGTHWAITIGFFRPWDRKPDGGPLDRVLVANSAPQWRKRTFKIVYVNDASGEVTRMKLRQLDGENS